ncbi:MAG TPA: prephenate dehydrogenase/arogenate dehydrogenase family protein [Thermoanaerobaculia bacterium]|nr:prephenate dehydrogenase/arogenate dehydrogenase family protein [Thermoanaerobaculia bacterium]
MSLDELRQRLQAVDRRILELVGERQRLATAIGRAKQAVGMPTRDFRQEREVVERAREAAEAHGVSPQLGEELLLLLIRSSLTAQEQDLVSARGAGTGRRVLVIGGAGRMGRWFARFLASQGFAVAIADPAGELPGVPCHRDWRQLELDHDLVLVATPLAATDEILHQLAERRPAGVVFDIGSLKGPLRSGLAACAAAGMAVTSIHPMFGPDTALLSGRHVIFVDVGAPAATAAVRELFASTMAVRVDMDLESHDHLIAYVLGLSHAVNLAFFTALAESGEAAPKLAELSSTTFDAQLAVASRVAQENPELYFEIQARNDYGSESLAALLYAVERIRSLVRAGDAAGFARLMEKGRAYLGGRRGGGAGA